MESIITVRTHQTECPSLQDNSGESHCDPGLHTDWQ